MKVHTYVIFLVIAALFSIYYLQTTSDEVKVELTVKNAMLSLLSLIPCGQTMLEHMVIKGISHTI